MRAIYGMQGFLSSLVDSSGLFSNKMDRVPSDISLDTKMEIKYVQYYLLLKVKLLTLKALTLACMPYGMHITNDGLNIYFTRYLTLLYAPS